MKTGKIGEHYAIIELLKKNYNVYRPVIDENNIDYVIEKERKIHTIQIRTSISFNKKGFMFRVHRDKLPLQYDYLLCVCLDRTYNIVSFYMIPAKDIEATTINILPDSQKSKWCKYKW